MHLFAAQPGGFSDDEGIIDLDQRPARLVILSAADSVLSLLAASADSLAGNYPSLRLANWLNLRKPAAFDLYSDKVLETTSDDAPMGAEVVVLSLLGGASYWRYGLEQLMVWAKKRPGRTLIVVPGEDYADPELLNAGNVTEATAFRVWRYLREGGHINAEALYAYIGHTFFGIEPCVWQEPMPLPRVALYHPHKQNVSYETWLREWIDQGTEHQPTVILTMYRSHVQAAETQVFNLLLEVLQKEGLNVLPLVVASLKEAACLKMLNRMIECSKASLVLNATGFAIGSHINDADTSSPSEQESPLSSRIPVLQLILASTTHQQWKDGQRGLRARDIAMQISLPELDGRIITRAVAFKSHAQRHSRSQIDSVCFTLDVERAVFVAQLAKRWVALANLRNDEKKIAIVLANYPASDARIGNGVGLDTPESTLNLLRWLKSADYDLNNLPQTSTELMIQLRRVFSLSSREDYAEYDSIPHETNGSSYPLRRVWLGYQQYQHHFLMLPKENRIAITKRWGLPQHDPRFNKERSAFSLSILMLGNIAVGVQPARGFEIDQQALYHDPDLVPPHHYLAFYFWLRDIFGAHAVVHMGKHGNLEWLPGKGTALSAECWPDIALGPLPNIYPFIVNDPGEGAQAKRRAQAVIIDHLMPPMARAELYGDLSILEELADEYYQALGVDPRRESRLRTLIALKLRDSGLAIELGLNQNADEQQLLEELDAYLCDIKEASIRNGLHTLGTCPQDKELTETLLSLLRLPRGPSRQEQGILHALAKDVGLPPEYDPLAIPKGAWEGPRPSVLENILSAPWITVGDTRERLEILAAQLVSASLSLSLRDQLLPRENELSGDRYHATRQVLNFAHQRLLPAIKQSARNEQSALLSALEGRFVPPGPSGAPTRGRLDVLPTGRNFYTVDSRAIPSKTAWSLGQQAAEALIERYLQEHGDYPRSLGLSVWGTATMRTGGDDIAQAMALMGIEPIWASGSQRLIDFRIIPAFQLGRPRVDVTLRVSGLFRDAFPNVIALLDAAVLKLSAYEEPGDDNTIRIAVMQRTSCLEAEGHSHEDAWRRASYRIFGAKPGAYGAGIQGVLDSGQWHDKRDLGGAYVQWGGYVYGQHLDGNSQGIADFSAFEARLASLQVVLHNQDNREHDILDSADYSQYQGGMAAASSALSEDSPTLYFGDHANPSLPRIRSLKEEFNRVLRSRLLNPKWQAAMRRHGYKGAYEMAASVDNLFAFDATSGIVDDHQYALVMESLLQDHTNNTFFVEHNPGARREIAERLLEAAQRTLWDANDHQREYLEELLMDIDDSAEHAGF